MSDDEMLKKWLLNKENKAFENGLNFTCDEFLVRCKSYSEPVLLSYGIDDFYVSIKDIENIVGEIRNL